VPDNPFDTSDPSLLDVASRAEGPSGSLPFTAEMLLTRPSGDLFGWSQNAGMGWNPAALGGREFLILSTHGGVRAPDGTPIALGYHTGHWEVGLLVEEAAKTLKAAGAVPFAAACTDPCDGRSQGTVAMFDSLPFRNDAAMVFGRLIRSLPTGRGVLGIATCDKGLPAMMMALAGARDLATVLVPGGVTLPPAHGEDAARIQTIGARYAHGELTLEAAADLGCRTCASPGGGCQFLGTAATSQVVGEALGLSLGHTALAPSGQPIWLDMARRSARALVELHKQKILSAKILTDAALRNAMADQGYCERWIVYTTPYYSAKELTGHRILTGGTVRPETGWFVDPTIVVTGDPTSFLMEKEFFGPLLTVHVYDDAGDHDGAWDKVLHQVDSTSEYALTCSIFANDRVAIGTALDRLRDTAGMTYVNDKPTGALIGRQAFGGGRGSGTNDKVGSPQALQRWVNARFVKENFNPAHDWTYPYMGVS